MKSPEEIIAAIWCIDNYIPLKHQNTNNLKIIFYEKLLSDMNKQLNLIFKRLNINNVNNLNLRDFANPSIVTINSDRKYIKNPADQLSKWKNSLTKKQINRILKVVSDFNMDFYSEEIEPNYSEITKF